MQTDLVQKHYHRIYQETNFGQFDDYERNRVLRKIYAKGNGKKLFDIGAGDGTVSQFFVDQEYDVHAIEWFEPGVQKLRTLGIHTIQQDIEKTPYPYESNYFDEIFWGDNIEHLFLPENVAKELHRILKSGGRLVLSTPNHGWIINRLYYLIMGVPRRTEGHKLPIWEWQHIRYFNKREILKFLNHCGFHKGFIFHGAERRQPFDFLSTYFPSFLGSLMIVEARK